MVIEELGRLLEQGWFGAWHPGITTIAVYTLIVTQITIVSVTLYLHRHSAHRSLELHPALQHFFRFWLWLTTSLNTLEWTSVHRKHHALCETAEDPHSPKVKGLGEIVWNGVAHYIAAATPQTQARYGKGCPDDWIERKLYLPYARAGIKLMLLIDVALFGVLGLTVWAVQMIWIPLFAAGFVNGLGHAWGYRNFECEDAATNIVPWGVFIGGEELHNNHHTYPNSAKLSQKPWEFDAGWMWIRIFETLGLAKALSKGPIARRDLKRSVIDVGSAADLDAADLDIDIDTVWAVLNDRFRVMAHYADSVVAPAARREYFAADRNMRRLLRRAARILCREDTLVDAAGRDRIEKLTAHSAHLKIVYEMRQRLQAVWAKRGGNSEELLHSFRQWCADAEASGVEALSDFVVDLKSYTMPLPAMARV